MNGIELVAALAMLQYLCFGFLVGRARARWGVVAPATTGHEMFERYYRVQMNTLELLVVYWPAMWLAARHAPAPWVAGLGAVFIVGRVIYLVSYTREPGSRALGFALSLGPVVGLLCMGLWGCLRDALA